VKNTILLLMGLALMCLTTGSLFSAEAGKGNTNAALANQTGAAAVQDTSWRYVYHQGHWWFSRPSGSWDYYDGQRWVAYDTARTPSVAARPVLSQAKYSYDRTASGDSERYGAGRAPIAPLGSLEELQEDLAKTKRSMRRLEARLRAQEQRMRGRSQVSGVQAAELSELWHARQNDRRFYNFGTDAYYFQGKGHFVD
jgi:hypothetical protein